MYPEQRERYGELVIRNGEETPKPSGCTVRGVASGGWVPKRDYGEKGMGGPTSCPNPPPSLQYQVSPRCNSEFYRSIECTS